MRKSAQLIREKRRVNLRPFLETIARAELLSSRISELNSARIIDFLGTNGSILDSLESFYIKMSNLLPEIAALTEDGHTTLNSLENTLRKKSSIGMPIEKDYLNNSDLLDVINGLNIDMYYEEDRIKMRRIYLSALGKHVEHIEHDEEKKIDIIRIMLLACDTEELENMVKLLRIELQPNVPYSKIGLINAIDIRWKQLEIENIDFCNIPESQCSPSVSFYKYKIEREYRTKMSEKGYARAISQFITLRHKYDRDGRLPPVKAIKRDNRGNICENEDIL